MIFTKTPLNGVVIVTPEPRCDERGSLSRTFCAREFHAAGMNTFWSQCNQTHTIQKGTIRGLHFQRIDPEIKLIRCTRGSVFDVVVDIRPHSKTFGKHFHTLLSEGSAEALYVSEGFAHGFQALTDHCEMFYQMSSFYNEKSATGIRYDDPKLAIPWPLPNPFLSDRDLALPCLSIINPFK